MNIQVEKRHIEIEDLVLPVQYVNSSHLNSEQNRVVLSWAPFQGSDGTVL